MAIVSAAIVGLTAVSLAKVNHLAFNGLNASQIALQAQQYADAEAAIIKATAYTDLTAHNRADIQNSNGYQSEITLSGESDYSDVIKQKTATIKIYRNGEINPRATLNLLKLSVEQQQGGGSVPVGTIIAWPGSNHPTEGGTWLLCNGQSAAAYPKLKAIVGGTVPNLNGRFLEGTTGTPRSFKEAGLPNITGYGAWELMGQFDGRFLGGVFYNNSRNRFSFNQNSSGSVYGGTHNSLGFDASRCSAVYGRSSTVQPSSYTVRYYIKAA